MPDPVTGVPQRGDKGYNWLADMQRRLGSVSGATAPSFLRGAGGPLVGTALQALLMGVPAYYLTKWISPLFGADRERAKRLGRTAAFGAGGLALAGNAPQLMQNISMLFNRPKGVGDTSLGARDVMRVLNMDMRKLQRAYDLGQRVRSGEQVPAAELGSQGNVVNRMFQFAKSPKQTADWAEEQLKSWGTRPSHFRGPESGEEALPEVARRKMITPYLRFDTKDEILKR